MAKNNATIIEAVEAYKKGAKIYNCYGVECFVDGKDGAICSKIFNSPLMMMEKSICNWTIEWPTPVFEHWDKYPDAEWVARIWDGTWKWFKEEPVLSKEPLGCWDNKIHDQFVHLKHMPSWDGDWRDSKIRRPEDV